MAYAKSQTRRAAGDIVRLAITLPGRDGGPGPVHSSEELSADALAAMAPRAESFGRLEERLRTLGMEVTGHGKFSLTARCPKSLYERLFGTRLTRHRLPRERALNSQMRAFYYPAAGAPWNPDPSVTEGIDDAYIQWPHIYLNSRFGGNTSGLPPAVRYHHLRVPGDVAMLLNAAAAHRQGITGKGVRVAMIDSGFAQSHSYFSERGYRTNTVLAPGANEVDRDGNSHGTAESANLLAVAPDVEFTGIKLDNETDARLGANMLEGLQVAMQHNPQVISVSLGFDLCPSDAGGRRTSNLHLTSLPNGLRALEAEIRSIVASGVVVVFSSGNGHVGFPGMMPDVISAGGVYVDATGAMRASDYASAFASRIYPGRAVPDFCGLVGLAANGARYIMLPVDPGSKIDRTTRDRTKKDDAWAVISGTSAAAPQIAGVCALLLQRNPGLTPDDVRLALRETARDVVDGVASAASNQNDGALQAEPGNDAATGAGLVDAMAALDYV